MIAHGMDEPGAPRPEQLAAYVDGELGPEPQAEVEAWLADHPEAAAEVEALRSLARLWQADAPPEPSEAQWANVLTRIEAELPAARRPARRRLAWLLGTAAASAAAVLLAFLFYRPAEVVTPADPDPYPVVSSDDIEIISINAEDRKALVIGDVPVREPLTLLAQNEVTVNEVKSDVLGMGPYYVRDAAPMIIMMPEEEP